jgi:hypothetical protein
MSDKKRESRGSGLDSKGIRIGATAAAMHRNEQARPPADHPEQLHGSMLLPNHGEGKHDGVVHRLGGLATSYQ